MKNCSSLWFYLDKEAYISDCIATLHDSTIKSMLFFYRFGFQNPASTFDSIFNGLLVPRFLHSRLQSSFQNITPICMVSSFSILDCLLALLHNLGLNFEQRSSALRLRKSSYDRASFDVFANLPAAYHFVCLHSFFFLFRNIFCYFKIIGKFVCSKIVKICL